MSGKNQQNDNQAASQSRAAAHLFNQLNKEKTADETEVSNLHAEPEVAQDASSGKGLPANLQTKMEGAFGTSFNELEVKTNSVQAQEIGAHAFAQDNEIHFAPGKYDPETTGGQRLIGHELAHIVQQKQGKVEPNFEGNNLLGNYEPGLENEADRLGQMAAKGQDTGVSLGTESATVNAPAQFFFGDLMKLAESGMSAIESLTGGDEGEKEAEEEESTFDFIKNSLEAVTGMADEGKEEEAAAGGDAEAAEGEEEGGGSLFDMARSGVGAIDSFFGGKGEDGEASSAADTATGLIDMGESAFNMFSGGNEDADASEEQKEETPANEEAATNEEAPANEAAENEANEGADTIAENEAGEEEEAPAEEMSFLDMVREDFEFEEEGTEEEILMEEETVIEGGPGTGIKNNENDGNYVPLEYDESQPLFDDERENEGTTVPLENDPNMPLFDDELPGMETEDEMFYMDVELDLAIDEAMGAVEWVDILAENIEWVD